MKYSHVALLTDYGTRDEFVGVLKSVILDRSPHVTITDITHEVPPFDVRAGSLTLARAIQYVPSGVVVAVVDPGVGTSRRAIAVQVANGEGVLIGPDNGLLAPAVSMAGGAERAFVLTNTDLHLPAPGATFAGRDVFAPVAAFLCNGGSIEDVGEEVDANVLLPGVIPIASEEKHDSYGVGVRAEVLWVDHYGNCQLNVGTEDVQHLSSRIRFVIDDEVRSADVVSSFADVAPGAVGLVVDSYGMLALSCDRASAAMSLNVAAGDKVLLFAGTGETPVSTPVQLR